MVGRRQPLAAHAEHLAGLRAGSDFQSGAGADGGHLDGPAEDGGRQVEHQVVDDIVAVADKLGMLDFLDDHKQVAAHTAVARGVAFAFDGEGHAVRHAGGDGERYLFVLAYDTLAAAV